MDDAMLREDRMDGAPVLSWLTGLLWPDRSGVDVSLKRDRSRPPMGTMTWVAIPTASAPTMLVPLRARAGATALHQYNQSMSQVARLRKAGAGLAFRAGAGRLMGRGQLRVAGGRASAAWDDLIGTVLPEVTGLPRCEVAISVGRALRPNLKPVLQVVDRRGMPVAYVKIGWNQLTTALVRNEARALRALARSPSPILQAPRLLGERVWNGLSLTILSPLRHRLWRRGRINQPPATAVLAEVAELGGIEVGTLGDSAYLSELESRITSLPDTPRSSELTLAARRLFDRMGGVEMAFGGAHGDWAPWNMGRSGDRWTVWDWERSSHPAPVGSDALHFAFEVAYHKQGRRVGEAADMVLGRAAEQLDGLDVHPASRPALLELFLIERLLRLEDGRSLGLAVDDHLADGLSRAVVGRSS